MKSLILLFLCSNAFADFYIPDGSVMPNKLAASTYQSTTEMNLGLSASVSASALAVSLKQKDGSTNATSLRPVGISFRSSTASTGAFNVRSSTSSLSLVIPSGATLGQVSAISEKTFIYAQDNLGVTQLCATTAGIFDEGSVQTSTKISGAATSRSTLYCTSGATGGVRLIGRVTSTQASAGTWATTPSEVSVLPVSKPSISTASGSTQFINSASVAACPSSPCTVTQNGTWLGTMTRSSAGRYSAPLIGYASTPVCFGSMGVTASSGFAAIQATSSTNINIAVEDALNANGDIAFNILCIGGN